MSEAVARAVGAASGRTIKIKGKEYELKPLGVRELTEVERDCLEQYKRSYLKTFADNADLLGAEQAQKLLIEKVSECAKWDVKNLPPRFAYDSDRIELSESLKARILGIFAEHIDDAADEDRLRRFVATALDAGMVSDADYKDDVGKMPAKLQVPYVNWWITGCFAGMVSFLWSALKRYGVSRDDILDEFGSDMGRLISISRELEAISVPEAGNG